MDKEARAGEVWAAYLEVFALFGEGTITQEQAKPVLSALSQKWQTLQKQYIEECAAMLPDIDDVDEEAVLDAQDAGNERTLYEFIPDCRCGASSSHGIAHARWCENRED